VRNPRQSRPLRVDFMNSVDIVNQIRFVPHPNQHVTC
jgi:hypothetical protein